MALAKISLSSTDPPLYIHFLPSSSNHRRHHRLNTADWNSYLLMRKKKERKIESKQNHIQHIYTITKHIKYVLGHNNIDCSKIYPSFICAVLSLEKLYYFFAEMCYIYIYTYSISQKWVHPSHFCKYFIIFFSCDNTEEMTLCYN